MGVVDTKLRGGENVGYAIKSSRLRSILEDLPDAKVVAGKEEQYPKNKSLKHSRERQ